MKAPFAASSNGKSFVFTDLIKGHEEEFSMEEFPTQSELWQKFVQDKQYTPEQIEIISKDYYHGTDGKEPCYYVLANFVIPLPPLEEQEEIVKKVEELLYIFMNI